MTASASPFAGSFPSSWFPTNSCSRPRDKSSIATTSKPSASFPTSTSFRDHLLADLRLMMRTDTVGLDSNPQSTPIIAFQDRGFSEEYLKGTASYHRGRHECKAGFEGDFTHLARELQRHHHRPVAVRSRHSGLTFQFSGRAPRSGTIRVHVQDLIRLGKWTVSAGLRWDHYQLLVNQNAVSPRLWRGALFQLGKSRAPCLLRSRLSDSRLRKHSAGQFAHSRVAESAGSPVAGQAFAGELLRGGPDQVLRDKLKLMGTISAAIPDNYADDDLLLNTAVSFPIAFRQGHDLRGRRQN